MRRILLGIRENANPEPLGFDIARMLFNSIR